MGNADGTKLPCYKQIPSVQTILFVKQDTPELIVMERQTLNQRHETTFTTAHETLPVADEVVSLRQIYRDMYF